MTKVTGWARRKPQLPAAFFGALLFGIAAQGMGLFNKFSHHDDIMALFSVGSTISSGRWMLHVLDWLETLIFWDGHFSLPLTHGLFSLLCIAGTACLLTELLSIRRPALAAALGAVMTAFPAVTGWFGYMYTMPYYVIALGMTVISVWLICRETPWWAKVLAVVLAGCAVGIYQTFIPLLLSITLLYDLMLLANGKIKIGPSVRKMATQALCIMGAMAFYFAANRFFLTKFQLELNSYMGINQMGSTSLGTYLERAGRAYREFFLPARNVSADIFPMHLYYVSRVMVCGDLLLAMGLILRTGRKHRGRALLMILLFALMPLGCNFIYVMSKEVHGLMTYGQVTQIVLFIWLADGAEIRRPKVRKMLTGAAAAALGLMCIMYARYDNQCYMKAAFQQQQAVSWYTALAARIKSTEGYRDDLPVAFLNQENITDGTVYNIDELEFIELDPYGDDMLTYLNSYAWRSFMERWCGFSPAYAEAAQYAALPETEAMPHYPDDGSVRNLGDVIIVNF